MTSDELERLNKAATEGQWSSRGTCTLDGPQRIHVSPAGHETRYAECLGTFVARLNGRDNATFIVELVNAYRRGNLVWKDQNPKVAV